jgi:hypothetical protein
MVTSDFFLIKVTNTNCKYKAKVNLKTYVIRQARVEGMRKLIFFHKNVNALLLNFFG